MKNFKNAVIPGDGTGPEVVDEGIKVLKALGEKKGFKFDFKQSFFTHYNALQLASIN